jgi:hypothetical protein
MSKKFYGAQSIEQKLSYLLKPIFQGSKKEFILINNLVKNWEEIVGKKYAKFCYPKNIKFEKSDKSARLTIVAYNSAIGFFLENNSEIILERIAVSYGFKSISKIIIKQEPKNIKSFQNKEFKLLQSQEEFVEKNISKVTDKDLAQTLQKLGREILLQSKTS